MMKPTKQLLEWKGDFGDAYIERNPVTEDVIRKRSAAFARMMQPLALHEPRTILEVGANIGLNLRALRRISAADLYAVEPNPQARKILKNDKVIPETHIHAGSAEELPFPDGSIDLVITCTVLIHVPDETLERALREIHRVAGRNILVAEYFSPSTEMIRYRGKNEMLYKRDYGGIVLDLFQSTVELTDYGFLWKRATALDNVNYWLFRKNQP